jgi:hypothetical protein
MSHKIKVKSTCCVTCTSPQTLSSVNLLDSLLFASSQRVLGIVKASHKSSVVHNGFPHFLQQNSVFPCLIPASTFLRGVVILRCDHGSYTFSNTDVVRKTKCVQLAFAHRKAKHQTFYNASFWALKGKQNTSYEGSACLLASTIILVKST